MFPAFEYSLSIIFKTITQKTKDNIFVFYRLQTKLSAILLIGTDRQQNIAVTVG